MKLLKIGDRYLNPEAITNVIPHNNGGWLVYFSDRPDSRNLFRIYEGSEVQVFEKWLAGNCEDPGAPPVDHRRA